MVALLTKMVWVFTPEIWTLSSKCVRRNWPVIYSSSSVHGTGCATQFQLSRKQLLRYTTCSRIVTNGQRKWIMGRNESDQIGEKRWTTIFHMKYETSFTRIGSRGTSLFGETFITGFKLNRRVRFNFRSNKKQGITRSNSSGKDTGFCFGGGLHFF